jgi:hypothetical protein
VKPKNTRRGHRVPDTWGKGAAGTWSTETHVRQDIGEKMTLLKILKINIYT